VPRDVTVSFEKLAQHVASLGGVRCSDGKRIQALDADQLVEVSALIDGPLPAAWEWWLATYGVGIKFAEPVVYYDVAAQTDVMIGHFMTIDEMHQTIDDLEYSLAPRHLPFNDDASGNYLVIDREGRVSWHIHDAPTDQNAKPVADSFATFVLMLRRGD